MYYFFKKEVFDYIVDNFNNINQNNSMDVSKINY